MVNLEYVHSNVKQRRSLRGKIWAQLSTFILVPANDRIWGHTLVLFLQYPILALLCAKIFQMMLSFHILKGLFSLATFPKSTFLPSLSLLQFCAFCVCESCVCACVVLVNGWCAQGTAMPAALTHYLKTWSSATQGKGTCSFLWCHSETKHHLLFFFFFFPSPQ